MKKLRDLVSRLLGTIVGATVSGIKHRLFPIAVCIVLLYLGGLLLEDTTSASRWFFLLLLPTLSFIFSPKETIKFAKYLITGKQ